MRKLRVVALAAATAAVLAAPAVAHAPAKRVNVRDYAYKPGRLTVRRGAKVTWHFLGASAHNVTVYTGPTHFQSPNKTGGTWSHVFNRKGVYHLFCTLHTYMTETIIVK